MEASGPGKCRGEAALTSRPLSPCLLKASCKWFKEIWKYFCLLNLFIFKTDSEEGGCANHRPGVCMISL